MEDLEPKTRAHAMIGMAVLASQGLELLFALLVKLVFKYKPGTSPEDITPLEKNFTKPSMRALLKELKKHATVSEEFEVKLNALIERRHVLIHRWAVFRGLPAKDGDYSDLFKLASSVSAESNELSKMLIVYLVDWMYKSPQMREALSQVGYPVDSQPDEIDLGGLFKRL